jgi:hypothetical protein
MNPVDLLELDERRLDQLLYLWERFMRSSQPYRELWYPNGATGCVGGGYSQSFDDMVEAADTSSAEGVNAAIDSLEGKEQAAVYHTHLEAHYGYVEPVDVVYARARGQLRVWLPSRGVY